MMNVLIFGLNNLWKFFVQKRSASFKPELFKKQILKKNFKEIKNQKNT